MIEKKLGALKTIAVASPSRRTVRTRWSMTAIGAALCSVALPAGAQERPPTVLGTLGGPSAEAAAINEDGAIIGTAQTRASDGRVRERRATWHGFYKPSESPLVHIDFEGTHADPQAINAEGLVVATLKSSNSQSYGSIIWTENEGARELVAPDGFRRAIAVDVDDGGNVLFRASHGDGESVAFLFDTAAETTEQLCSGCVPAAINGDGEVLVDFVAGTTEQGLALRATDGTFIRLPQDGRFVSYRAVDLNDHGTVLGVATDARGASHVVVWRGSDHTLRDVGEGEAYAINNYDVIAGACFDDAASRSGRHACLFDVESARIVDLPDLTDSDGDSVAVDINDSGVAVGTIYGDEGSHAVEYAAYEPGRSTNAALPRPGVGAVSGSRGRTSCTGTCTTTGLRP